MSGADELAKMVLECLSWTTGQQRFAGRQQKTVAHNLCLA